MRRDVAILLALLAAAPLASAATTGDLTTSEPITARPEGPAEGSVGALRVFVNKEAPVFEVHARRAMIYEYDVTALVWLGWVHVPPIDPLRPELAAACTGLADNEEDCATRSYPLTDLRVSIAQSQRGRFTILDPRPDEELARVRLEPEGELDLTPIDETDPTEQFPETFWHFYTKPYLAWEGDDEVVVSGDFSLEALESLVRLDAAENSTVVDTRSKRGWGGDRGAPSVERVTMLFLVLEDAEWRLRSDDPTLIAFRTLDAPDVSAASLRDAHGTLAGRAVRGETLLLEGDFALSLTAGGSGDDAVAFAAVDGEIVGYGGEARAARPASAAPALWRAGVLGASLALVVGVALLVRRRAAHDVDECVRRAGEAAEARDHVRALAWTQAALARAPTSAALHADAGYFLQEIGEVDEALAAYARAADLSTDGEADFLSARLLAGVDAGADAIAPHLARALSREPALLLELRDDPALRTHLRHPLVAARARESERLLR